MDKPKKIKKYITKCFGTQSLNHHISTIINVIRDEFPSDNPHSLGVEDIVKNINISFDESLMAEYDESLDSVESRREVHGKIVEAKKAEIEKLIENFDKDMIKRLESYKMPKEQAELFVLNYSHLFNRNISKSLPSFKRVRTFNDYDEPCNLDWLMNKIVDDVLDSFPKDNPYSFYGDRMKNEIMIFSNDDCDMEYIESDESFNVRMNHYNASVSLAQKEANEKNERVSEELASKGMSKKDIKEIMGKYGFVELKNAK